MAKTLRVTQKPGWASKALADTEANALTPAEVDDNFITLYEDNAQVGTARLEPSDAALHPDWLVLDGSTFAQSTYPLLYTRLGNSNVLPDLSADAPIQGVEWRIRAK